MYVYRCLIAQGSTSPFHSLLRLPLFDASIQLRAFSSEASSSASDGQQSTKSQPPSQTNNNIQPQSTARDSLFSSGARMVQRGSGGSRAGTSLHGIIHVHNSTNNIILTLTDLNGQVKACSSAGSAGFRNARKSLPVAAERAAEDLAKKAMKLGYESARCHLKGVGNNKQYAVQSLASSGIRLTHLIETTSFPHNGCRGPKRRRI